MSEDGTRRNQIERSQKVVCENCEEFEMGKQFSGTASTEGELEYVAINLPDACPVCGAKTKEKRGDLA